MHPLLGSLFPIKFWPPPKPAKYDRLIIINWLEFEVDPRAPFRMPLLHFIKGWRNRDVYYFIRDEWPDWTARACQRV
jgi:hypothetical protein